MLPSNNHSENLASPSEQYFKFNKNQLIKDWVILATLLLLALACAYYGIHLFKTTEVLVWGSHPFRFDWAKKNILSFQLLKSPLLYLLGFILILFGIIRHYLNLTRSNTSGVLINQTHLWYADQTATAGIALRDITTLQFQKYRNRIVFKNASNQIIFMIAPHIEGLDTLLAVICEHLPHPNLEPPITFKKKFFVFNLANIIEYLFIFTAAVLLLMPLSFLIIIPIALLVSPVIAIFRDAHHIMISATGVTLTFRLNLRQPQHYAWQNIKAIQLGKIGDGSSERAFPNLILSLNTPILKQILGIELSEQQAIYLDSQFQLQTDKPAFKNDQTHGQLPIALFHALKNAYDLYHLDHAHETVEASSPAIPLITQQFDLKNIYSTIGKYLSLMLIVNLLVLPIIPSDDSLAPVSLRLYGLCLLMTGLTSYMIYRCIQKRKHHYSLFINEEGIWLQPKTAPHACIPWSWIQRLRQVKKNAIQLLDHHDQVVLTLSSELKNLDQLIMQIIARCPINFQPPYIYQNKNLLKWLSKAGLIFLGFSTLLFYLINKFDPDIIFWAILLFGVILFICYCYLAILSSPTQIFIENNTIHLHFLHKKQVIPTADCYVEIGIQPSENTFQIRLHSKAPLPAVLFSFESQNLHHAHQLYWAIQKLIS